MNNAKPSTSKPPSSSSPAKNRKRKADQVDDGQDQDRKTIKEDLEPRAQENQDQIKVEDKSFIGKLPQEMLVEILKYLDKKSLLAARGVNRNWKGIAHDLLKSRKDVEIVLNLARLEKFIKYYQDTEERPCFTRFRFDDVNVGLFEDGNWIQFIDNFGESIKCLKLVLENDEHEWKLATKLRHLLTNQLPELQELGVKIRWSTQYSSKIKLFPTTTRSRKPKTTKNPEGGKITAARPVQLPHLKVLYLSDSTISNGTKIVTDLLEAAVNLEKIATFERDDSFYFTDHFRLFQSLGKLQCLQAAYIKLYNFLLHDDREVVRDLDSTLFKLKKLHLDIHCQGNDFPGATEFVSNLLESSKDTLTEMTFMASEISDDLQLPIFSKLTKLRFVNINKEDVQILPDETNLKEIFPVLKKLELEGPWNEFFPDDVDGACYPILKKLCIPAFGTTEEDIIRISEMCPVLKELNIFPEENEQPITNFPTVGRAIWMHMKQLQSLDLTIDTSFPANAFPAIDSCISGFSKEYCEHLYNSSEIEKSLEIGQVTEAELEAERKNPSILDLKDLKILKILLICVPQKVYKNYSPDEDDENNVDNDDEDEAEEIAGKDEEQQVDKDQEELEQESEPEETSESEEEMSEEELEKMNQKAMTFISKEYTLKLMKNLTYEIETMEEQY